MDRTAKSENNLADVLIESILKVSQGSQVPESLQNDALARGDTRMTKHGMPKSTHFPTRSVGPILLIFNH